MHVWCVFGRKAANKSTHLNSPDGFSRKTVNCLQTRASAKRKGARSDNISANLLGSRNSNQFRRDIIKWFLLFLKSSFFVLTQMYTHPSLDIYVVCVVYVNARWSRAGKTKCNSRIIVAHSSNQSISNFRVSDYLI